MMQSSNFKWANLLCMTHGIDFAGSVIVKNFIIYKEVPIHEHFLVNNKMIDLQKFSFAAYNFHYTVLEKFNFRLVFL